MTRKIKPLFKLCALLCCLALVLAGCSFAPKQSAAQQALDGKKVLFVGDSFLSAGRAVLPVAVDKPEAVRQNDQGYFSQICKANGLNVSVTNWSHGGYGLGQILTKYVPNFTDFTYDYVIFSGGRNSKNTYADLEATLDTYMEMFRQKNPDVKFLYLISSGAHNISVKESFPIDLLNNMDALEEKGFTIVDWGKLVADIIRGEVAVPGATLEYNNHSFVHNKSESDGYHPNQLTGYLTALMTYCAITGESAADQPYEFWCDANLSAKFEPDAYTAYAYTRGPSNYRDIFASKADMKGLQQLMDQYLADKAYRTYNFS